jgi:cobalamin synthase
VFSAYSYRRIGGATGDTLGASCELAEAATALTMAGWYGGHG